MDQLKTKAILTKTGVVILLAAVCGILWGSAFPSVKTGYELFQIAPEDNASKLLFAGIRFGMAGLVTILFASLKRSGPACQTGAILQASWCWDWCRLLCNMFSFI